MRSMDDQRDITALVIRLYAALAAGDRDELEAVLDPAFVGDLVAGMPGGAGGRHEGAQAMRRNGWGALGRLFAVAPGAETFVPCADGRLLVVGAYRGTARSTGRDLDARFMHLWTARDGRLSHVLQVTDTAAFADALES
jgi:2-(1,2-epoxy-1,2-dihydrophenyl)acetyl-CoA isomerase